MSAQLFFLPYQVATVNGIAQSGAKLYFYTTGTTTPQPIYSDAGLSVPLTNPVTANGAGRFPDIYLDNAVVYRLIVKDSAGATLEDVDPYTPGTIDVVGFVADGDKGDLTVSGNGATWTIDPSVISTFGRTLTDDADAPTARTTLDVPSNADMTAAIAAVGTGGGGADQPLSQVIAGLGIAWTGSLNFTMSAGSYYINGTVYTAAEQSITLSTADATNSRIDVLAVDTTGTLVKVNGTAAANPSQPDVDPATQLFLKFVIVPAGATAPVIAADEIVFEENDGVGEWTGATISGTSVVFNSTSEPDSGTVCIAATSAGSSAAGVIRLNKGSTISVDTLDSIVIRFKSKTTTWGTGQVRIHLQNASGVRVGAVLSIKNGSYGLTTSNTSTYQTLTIPITAFAIPAGTNLQYLQIADNTGAAISWRMDNIKLKKSSTATGGTSNGITQTQGDARYAQRANNLSDIVSASTARTNLGLGTVATLASDTDGTLAANSDSRVATQKAVKTYADGAIASGGGTDLLKGQYRTILSVYNSATPTVIGCVGLFTNCSGATYATTNIATRRVRTTLLHSSAGTSGHARTNGGGEVVGGTSQYKSRTRWSVVTGPSTMALAAGAMGNYAPSFPTFTEPSAALNCVFAGFDTTDSNVQVMHNDGSGTCTKIDLGSNFPAKTTGVFYEAKFEADGGGNIVYTVTRFDSSFVATGTISTNMPVENVYSSGLIAGVTTAQSWEVAFHRHEFVQNHTLGY